MNKVWFAGSVVGVEGTKIGRRAGGIVGSVPKDSKLILSNALYTGSTEVLPVSSTNYAGGLVGQITGTNSAADISESLAMGTVVVADKYNGQIAGQIGAQAKVNVDKVYAVTEGKAVGTGTPTGTIEIVTADAIKGEAAREALSLAFDTIWITVEGSAPEINDLSEHRIPLPTEPDTEWYDAGASEYTISTINELYGLAELAKKDQFKGKTIKIAADIVLNEDHANFAEWGTTAPTYEWIPMGATEYVANNTNGFSGTIDGQGHTIYGLYSKQAADLRGGLFNTLTNATIKNLKLTNCYFENALNAQRFGGFAGVACGTTFENVYTNAIVKNTTSANHVAGFVGQGWGVTFRNCWFDGEVSNEGSNGTSGFLGTCTEAAALVYENCLYTGKITVTKEDARAGAFIGYAFYHTRNLTFTNCLSAGSITGPGALANAGSFSGLFNNGTDGVITAAYTNCYAVTGSATSGKTIVLPESTTSVVTGSVTEVAKNDITGEAAKTTLAGFDFDSVWTAVTEGEGSTPVLTSLQ